MPTPATTANWRILLGIGLHTAFNVGGALRPKEAVWLPRRVLRLDELAYGSLDRCLGQRRRVELDARIVEVEIDGPLR
jgi:hypothetical protein